MAQNDLWPPPALRGVWESWPHSRGRRLPTTDTIDYKLMQKCTMSPLLQCRAKYTCTRTAPEITNQQIRFSTRAILVRVWTQVCGCERTAYRFKSVTWRSACLCPGGRLVRDWMGMVINQRTHWPSETVTTQYQTAHTDAQQQRAINWTLNHNTMQSHVLEFKSL